MTIPIPQAITAVGGLGTAAFGVVDATKVLWGGVNHVGFGGIEKAVRALTPPAPGDHAANALSQDRIIATLHANWVNGTDLGSQKAIAKSLIKLNMSAGNAPALAAATGVDSDVLAAVAGKIAVATPLTPAESDVYARFDVIVTALLDETYQHSDQLYRNSTRALAMLVAVGLALVGKTAVDGVSYPTALLAGILATPLAPMAKDLSSALATAVNALQAVRK